MFFFGRRSNQETRVKSSGSKLQFSQHSNGGLLAEKVSGQKAAESFCPAGEPLGLDDVTLEITVDRGWGGFCWGRFLGGMIGGFSLEILVGKKYVRFLGKQQQL